jgi:hypothetical protein
MREIPLLKADGTIDECAVGIVQACMEFPDDADSINEDIAAFRLRAATGFRRTALGKHLQRNWRASQFGGMCAGSMLYTMCMFKKHHPEMEVGMNKSAFEVAIRLEKFGTKISKSASAIKDYWIKYKNSAHLWAAFMLEYRDNKTQVIDDQLVPAIDILKVLDVAEQLIDCGSLVVVDWNPWRTPPAILRHTSFEIARPDSEDISLMEGYRADGHHLIQD